MLSSTALKLCGLTRAEDIQLCEELGVEYIGFNFVPSSPRCLTTEQAQELRFVSQKMHVVGVFADEPIERVESIARALSLDLIQLHGNETLDDIQALHFPIIKAFRMLPSPDTIRSFMSAGARVLLDGVANGEKAHWDAIAQLPADVRQQLFLAGGITPDNVVDAIKTVGPYAIDVASGVEAGQPGIKDHDAMRALVNAIESVHHIPIPTGV